MHYLRDPECRFYLAMLVLGSLVTCLYLVFSGTYGWQKALLNGSFELVSILKRQGLGWRDFSVWPTFLPFLILPSLLWVAVQAPPGVGLR